MATKSPGKVAPNSRKKLPLLTAPEFARQVLREAQENVDKQRAVQMERQSQLDEAAFAEAEEAKLVENREAVPERLRELARSLTFLHQHLWNAQGDSGNMRTTEASIGVAMECVRSIAKGVDACAQALDPDSTSVVCAEDLEGQHAF